MKNNYDDSDKNDKNDKNDDNDKNDNDDDSDYNDRNYNNDNNDDSNTNIDGGHNNELIVVIVKSSARQKKGAPLKQLSSLNICIANQNPDIMILATSVFNVKKTSCGCTSPLKKKHGIPLNSSQIPNLQSTTANNHLQYSTCMHL